jgi:hypothetical protein
MLIVVLVVLAALLTGLVLWWRSMAATQRALNARDPELAVVVAQIRERQTALAEPTLGLVPADKPGFSKLGGRPDLPAGVAHPQGERGAQKFLAQLDLAEVRAAGGPDWLPATGRIYAFYDDWRHGFSDVVTILHDGFDATAATTEGEAAFPERRVGFEAGSSGPSIDWLGVDYRGLGGWGEDLLTPEPEGPAHRVGGYPDEIQEDRFPLLCEHMARGLPDPDYGGEVPPDIERAAEDWRLLLQVDSDSDLKMNFGDGGRLYVFIRRSDARRGEFGKAVGAWHTY